MKRERSRKQRRAEERRQRKAQAVANKRRQGAELYGHFLSASEKKIALVEAANLDWLPSTKQKRLYVHAEGEGEGFGMELTFSSLIESFVEGARVMVGAADHHDGVFFAWDSEGRTSGPFPDLDTARAAAVVAS